jgi:hypothetical protein
MAAGESQLGGVGFPGQLLDIGETGGLGNAGLPEHAVAGTIRPDQADLISVRGGADIGDVAEGGGRGRGGRLGCQGSQDGQAKHEAKQG